MIEFLKIIYQIKYPWSAVFYTINSDLFLRSYSFIFAFHISIFITCLVSIVEVVWYQLWKSIVNLLYTQFVGTKKLCGSLCLFVVHFISCGSCGSIDHIFYTQTVGTSRFFFFLQTQLVGTYKFSIYFKHSFWDK